MGGPEFDNIQKGAVFAWWAAVQSFVPVLSGGFADRFGYKNTVGVSIGIKVLGYVVMGFAVDIASLLTAGESAATPGATVTYAVFSLGALLLALGTAIFKPGIQGIIATQLTERNAAVGWAVFYQLVNWGGFLGPYLAGVMRLLAWKWVFLACAAIVSVNYLILLTFPEPAKEVADDDQQHGVYRTLWDSVAGILEPRLLAFLAIFSGFWAMFYQLFDLLPNFIDHWVDSRGVHDALVAPLFALFGSETPDAWGGMVPQEFLISLNAFLIMLFAFSVGMLTGRMRSMTSMIVGILVSAAGISLLASRGGWAILAAIAVFSLGEMLASPTKMRYVAGIAPPGKKALYLGYVNATTGIGWSLGSLIAGTLYEEQGDLHVLGRRHLVELGEGADAVAALPKSDVLPELSGILGVSEPEVIGVLWTAYAPWSIWGHFAVIGVVSMAGLIAFDAITRRDVAWEPFALAALTGAVTGQCYGWTYGLGFAAVIAAWHLWGAAVSTRAGRPVAGWLDRHPMVGVPSGVVIVGALTAMMLIPPG